MRLIENNHEEKKSWKIVCPNCNSVLEYEKEDVIIKGSMFFYFHYIKCPCCGKTIDVENW